MITPQHFKDHPELLNIYASSLTVLEEIGITWENSGMTRGQLIDMRMEALAKYNMENHLLRVEYDALVKMTPETVVEEPPVLITPAPESIPKSQGSLPKSPNFIHKPNWLKRFIHDQS